MSTLKKKTETCIAYGNKFLNYSLSYSSKSEAGASSIGTKTTVEADVVASNNTYLNQQSASHQMDEMAETKESSVIGLEINNESTCISSTALVHIPPSKASSKKIKGKKDVPK